MGKSVAASKHKLSSNLPVTPLFTSKSGSNSLAGFDPPTTDFFIYLFQHVSLRQDDPHELLVIEMLLLIQIGLFEEFVELLLCELLTQVCHGVAELSQGYRRAVRVEN